MSLPHALLTSLLERRSTGSDLTRRFDSSIGFFWRATHQQIYRELGRMERSGWVAASGDPDNARRRVYRVLPAGEEELVRWAREPSPAPALRDALFVRLRAEATIGPLGLGETVRGRLAGHEAALAAYRLIEARDFGEERLITREARVQHLILQAGIDHERRSARWCREALDLLEE